MVLKFSIRFLFLFLLLSTSIQSYAQFDKKTQEALEQKDYSKVLDLLKKQYFNGKEDLAYTIGETYRKTFDFAQASEWHQRAISDGTQASYYGYCMTLIQMGRIEECLKYAKQKLLLNPNSKDLPKIIETCRRHLNPSRKKDSLSIFSNLTMNQLYPIEKRGQHEPSSVESETAPLYFISSIYPDKKIDERILSQNKTSLPRVIENKELSALGFQYKKDKIGIFTFKDMSDVSHLIYPDFISEYKHSAHYSGIESFKMTSVNGKVEEIEGAELFKDKRAVKFPVLSADGTVLIFASKDLRGGYGGYDLYRMIYRSPFWSNPEHLGPSINTSGDEIYPFISFDNKLYFSSNGLGGYGDLDIFSIDLEVIGEEAPELLEAPANSMFDDFAYVINSKSGMGFFASNRKGSLDADLYPFEKVFDNCGSEVLFTEERSFIPCNDSAFCVDFDITGSMVPEGVPLECLWDIGDGHKRYGEKFKYCYRNPGLYKAVLNVSVKNDKGVVEKNKFDVEIDIRNREALL